MQFFFILNPAAGQVNSADMLRKKIAQTFADHPSVHVYETSGAGDATDYVRDRCLAYPNDTLRFYACGGDGTFSEVAAGAMAFPHAAVGLIPVGTGNDFVRNFSGRENFLSMEAQKDAQVILADMIRCNDRYCVNMCNTGFDCEVVRKTQEIKRRVPAGMAYALGVVIELIKKPCVTMRVMADGQWVLEGKKLLCAVANGGYYGGGYHALPHASLTDGYMDVFIFDEISRTRFLTLIGKYKKGTHIIPRTRKFLKLLHCRSLRLEFPEVRSVSVDGELIEMQQCELEILPQALRLLVPRGSQLHHPAGEVQ